MAKYKLWTHTDLDGIGCAVLAKLAFGEDVDISYCNYDNIDEEVSKLVEDGELFKSYDRVYITDISVSDDVANMIDILDRSHTKVLLLDHHDTAKRLNKYDWCYVADDLTHSTYNNGELESTEYIKTCGTELFWMHLLTYYHISEEKFGLNSCNNIRKFVGIVRDYDTWRWKELGEDGLVCKQVNDLYYIYGKEKFIDWCIKHICNHLSPMLLFPDFDDFDLLLLDNKQKEIDKYIEEKDKQLIRYFDQFGYICGVVFAERFFSELGNRLAELHPELHYIAMIDISGGKVSYRTVKEDIDLGGEIAHSFGGGGHKKAAGSTFDKSSVEWLVMDWLFNDGKGIKKEEV